jgi:hypothetical protein
MLSPSKSQSSFGKKAFAWTDWSLVSPPADALYVVCAFAGDAMNKAAATNIKHKLPGNRMRFINSPSDFSRTWFPAEMG